MNKPTTTDAAIAQAFREISDFHFRNGDRGSWANQINIRAAELSTETRATAHGGDEDRDAVIACLGDDAAGLLSDNPEDERAHNMLRAAELLSAPPAGGFVVAWRPGTRTPEGWRNWKLDPPPRETLIRGLFQWGSVDATTCKRGCCVSVEGQDDCLLNGDYWREIDYQHGVTQPHFEIGAESPTAQPSAKDGVRVPHPIGWVKIDNDRRVIDFTNRQPIANGWRENPRNIVHPVYTGPQEATTAAGLVDDAMVERAINSLADYQRSVTTWGERERRESMRLALLAAIGREVSK